MSSSRRCPPRRQPRRRHRFPHRVHIGERDPVGSGLVASAWRDQADVTGLSTQATDLASKRVELLREVVPDLKVVALLAMSTTWNRAGDA